MCLAGNSTAENKAKISEFLQQIRERKPKQLVHINQLAAKKPRYEKLQYPLPEKLQQYVRDKKITFYLHQSEAINKIRQGKNVAITTSTASGKSIAFNMPVFEELIANSRSRALYLYPLKALTNDQLKTVADIDKNYAGTNAKPAVYDGDTRKEDRPSIRSQSRIVLSNMYAFHEYLWWHHNWKSFLSNLKFIVIDESHTYRGVFGSNVAMVIRRLLRICRFYGSDPQVVMASATISNPLEHAQKLTGKRFDIVADDGSGHGQKTFLFWNPAAAKSSGTKSKKADKEQGKQEDNDPFSSTPLAQAKELLRVQVEYGLQTLCFTTSRKLAELLAKWTREDLRSQSKYQLAEAIASYRAGYLSDERRQIEQGLKRGQYRGVVSTSAMELGIDIGSLDSVMIYGYPGTMVSTWQRAGRAGRGLEPSMVTIVGMENPLDQYFMNNPGLFFSSNLESAVVDLQNPYILYGHLACAAGELPLHHERDKVYFGTDNGKDTDDAFGDAVKRLVQNKLLRKRADESYNLRPKIASRPSDIVSLNSLLANDTIDVIRDGKGLKRGTMLVEQLEKSRALSEAHEGAVILHQGDTYVVDRLDLKQRVARVKAEDVNYYTQSLSDETIRILKKQKDHKVSDNVTVHVGKVNVTKKVKGYVKKSIGKPASKAAAAQTTQGSAEAVDNPEDAGIIPLSLPPISFDTKALWFTFGNGFENRVYQAARKTTKSRSTKSQNKDHSQKSFTDSDTAIDEQEELFLYGLHASEHAMISLCPLFAMCDRYDVGGLSINYHNDTQKPTLFIYDGYSGGIGISEKLYNVLASLVSSTLVLVKKCKCKRGCPMCIYSPKCGNNNSYLSKQYGIGVLEELNREFS